MHQLPAAPAIYNNPDMVYCGYLRVFFATCRHNLRERLCPTLQQFVKSRHHHICPAYLQHQSCNKDFIHRRYMHTSGRRSGFGSSQACHRENCWQEVDLVHVRPICHTFKYGGRCFDWDCQGPHDRLAARYLEDEGRAEDVLNNWKRANGLMRRLGTGQETECGYPRK